MTTETINQTQDQNNTAPTVSMQFSQLEAVSYAMAVKDVRLYLCGVHVEIDVDNNYRLIGTDGHRVHIYNSNLGRVGSVKHAFTIPGEIVKQILKMKNRKNDAFVLAPGEKESTIISGTGKLIFTHIDGIYPNYRNVFPKKINDQTIGYYKAEYIADAQKAVRCFKSSVWDVPVLQQGKGMGFVVYDNFLAGIMPYQGTPETSLVECMLERLQK